MPPSPPSSDGPVSNTSSSAASEIPEKKFKKLALEPGTDPLSAADGDLVRKSEDTSFICTCGMPLCICEVPSPPEPDVSAVTQPILSQKPVKREEKLPMGSPPSPFKPSAVSSSRSNMPSLFFFSGQLMHGSSHPLSKSYDLSGEGVDVNYFDRQGMSLLHLVRLAHSGPTSLISVSWGSDG